MLARVGETLDSEFVSLGHSGPQHLRIVGGKKLSGSIPVKTSKNAAVALLCASLLNKGRTTLRSLARIEEVNRIIEVLTSIGVRVRWLPDSNDLEIVPPARLDLDGIDVEAARRTRTVIMFLGPLLAELRRLPAAVRRWLRPRHAHRRAAPVGAAPLRPRRRRPRTASTRPPSTAAGTRSAPSSSPSAATPSPRTSSWPPPATRARRSSATPPRTTWSRTSASSSRASACRSRASARRP